MSEPLVIVGQGMAGTKLVEELSQHALGRYSIILVGDEPRRAYNRVMLSSLLAKEIEADDIELRPRDWWGRKGVTNIFGRRITSIDREKHEVAFEDGRTIAYSKLVLATGSHAMKPPVEGMDLEGVITFRWMEDVDRMLTAVEPGRPAVVIGGGLLGLEAAYGLAKAGVRVTLLHRGERLMERQLDSPSADLLRDAIASKGCDVVLGANTVKVRGTDRAEAVELDDGRVFEADLVVCAIGVTPNVDLAKSADLDCGRGILIDDRMRTSDPDIFAIGECTEHRGACYGLVEPGYEQARALARNLAGDCNAEYVGSILATNLKVSGVSLFSAGDFLGEGKEWIVYEDGSQNVYKKIVIDDGKLAGAVLYGDTVDGLWYLDLIKAGTPIGDMRDDLIFGRALVEREAEKAEEQDEAA